MWWEERHPNHKRWVEPLYTHPAPAAPVQEPVAQPASEEDMKVYRGIADNYRKDLAAAQRQWVGLTDEEINDVVSSLTVTDDGFIRFTANLRDYGRAIEAKLREKNGGAA